MSQAANEPEKSADDVPSLEKELASIEDELKEYYANKNYSKTPNYFTLIRDGKFHNYMMYFYKVRGCPKYRDNGKCDASQPVDTKLFDDVNGPPCQLSSGCFDSHYDPKNVIPIRRQPMKYRSGFSHGSGGGSNNNVNRTSDWNYGVDMCTLYRSPDSSLNINKKDKYDNICHYGDKCHDCHGMKEFRYHPLAYKTIECREYRKYGKCNFGLICWRYHDERDRRIVNVVKNNKNNNNKRGGGGSGYHDSGFNYNPNAQVVKGYWQETGLDVTSKPPECFTTWIDLLYDRQDAIKDLNNAKAEFVFFDFLL